jgi:TatA/E family protein of Tat protein translocase
MPFGIQPIHIIVLIVVALIIFGPKSLPEIGRLVGRSVTEFRKGMQDMTQAMRDEAAKAGMEQQEQSISKPAPTQSVSTEGKYCSKCGTPNPVDAAFCHKCGNPFPA